MERDATLETERDYGLFYRTCFDVRGEISFFFRAVKIAGQPRYQKCTTGEYIYIFSYFHVDRFFSRDILKFSLSLVRGNTDFRKLFSKHVQHGRRSERGGRNEARSSVHAWLNWRRCNTYNNMVRRIH